MTVGSELGVQFYEKFSVRFAIAVLLNHLFTLSAHRRRMHTYGAVNDDFPSLFSLNLLTTTPTTTPSPLPPFFACAHSLSLEPFLC